jgi:isoprenylcysteine carboxyl methyltransferase (ICMT) family protein YpbQ
MIGLGLSLMIFRWWVALLFFAVYLLIYLPLIGGEEKILASRFGDDFHTYCRKTAKFFPRKIIFSLPAKPAWIEKELASSLAPLIALIFALRAWADFKFFGSVKWPGMFFMLIIFSVWLLAFLLLARLKHTKNGTSGTS